MADKKISELTELTNADSNDVLAIVDITAGATKKIQAGNLVAASGELTIDVSSGSFDYLKTPIAPLVTEDFGANGKQQTNRLDDTTEEYVTFQRQAPHRSITGMKVYVEVYCKAVTWVTGKNVSLKLYISPAGDDEQVDAPFVVIASGDKALTTSGATYHSLITWNDTVANIGISSSDYFRAWVSRVAAASNNLAGDLEIEHVRLRFDV